MYDFFSIFTMEQISLVEKALTKKHNGSLCHNTIEIQITYKVVKLIVIILSVLFVVL